VGRSPLGKRLPHSENRQCYRSGVKPKGYGDEDPILRDTDWLSGSWCGLGFWGDRGFQLLWLFRTCSSQVSLETGETGCWSLALGLMLCGWG